MSLHRSLTLFVVVLAALALSAAVSLVLLTTYLHRTTVELEAALHSVRLAEEMQIDLLTYVRTSDPMVKREIEKDLRQKLAQAGQYVSGPEEEAARLEAEQLIEAHFSGLPDGENLERAFSALRKLVDINIEQADASLQESARWDDLGDRIGLGVGAGLILGVAVMLIWLGYAAFRPVFEIRDAMKAFATGRKDARAPEYGPEELRRIAAQFNEMADALVRQHDNQLTFLAAVAHDLRNPIGALKMSADVLSPDKTGGRDKVSELVSVIQRQVHRLDRMVGDLLDRSRIEGGHLELRIEDYEARDIAQNTFDLFSSASKKHEFVLNLPGKPVPIRCDPVRIEQVLNNLISNALKYSPDGGKVELSLEEIDGEVLFRVSDQGLGIAAAELPYIFEPFRRIRTAREDIPGVGLGLSVAQRIVQAHDGRIEAESQIGKGTTFRVYLHTPSTRMIRERAVS
jgi:signal transduction histidine kinase